MDPVPIPEGRVVVQKKQVQTRTVKKFFPAPIEIKGIIERISFETGVPYNDIEKVMWCESRYDQSARHINTNNSIDIGRMQINSIHVPTAEKMGLILTNGNDNATFAIYLIKQKIKIGHPPLEDWVCKP